MSKFNNVIVGDIIYLKPSDNHRTKTKILDATVTKVGRKYFYAHHRGESIHTSTRKYHLDTGIEECNHNYGGTAHHTREEIEDISEKNATYRSICVEFNNFNTYARDKFTLDQLRRIKEIIDESLGQ